MAAILILKDLGILIGAFLIGAIPFCYILSKIVSGKNLTEIGDKNPGGWNLAFNAVSYTHLRAHETRHDLVCRLLLEKKKKRNKEEEHWHSIINITKQTKRE